MLGFGAATPSSRCSLVSLLIHLVSVSFVPLTVDSGQQLIALNNFKLS